MEAELKVKSNIESKIKEIKDNLTYFGNKNNKLNNFTDFLKNVISDDFAMVKGYINDIIEKVVIYNVKPKNRDDFNFLSESIHDEFFYIEVFFIGSSIPRKLICSRMTQNYWSFINDEIVIDKNNKTMDIKDSFDQLNIIWNEIFKIER